MIGIPLRLDDGRLAQLRLDWNRVEALSAALGPSWDTALQEAFERFDASTVAIALGIMAELPPDEIMEASPPWLHAKEAAVAAYSVFMTGARSFQEAQQAKEAVEGGAAPLPPSTSSSGAGRRLIERVWRRTSSGPARSTRSPSGSAPAPVPTASI